MTQSVPTMSTTFKFFENTIRAFSLLYSSQSTQGLLDMALLPSQVMHVQLFKLYNAVELCRYLSPLASPLTRHVPLGCAILGVYMKRTNVIPEEFTVQG